MPPPTMAMLGELLAMIPGVMIQIVRDSGLCPYIHEISRTLNGSRHVQSSTRFRHVIGAATFRSTR